MADGDRIDSVKVRMYRHGFGDCFLLLFYSETKLVFSVLIDCGIKWNTKSKSVPISLVIDDLKDALPKDSNQKPLLDVLVVTHEHWDHVAYFHPTRGGNPFEGFDIDQIWLAWTENPQDAEAVAINSRLREATVALGIASELLSDNVNIPNRKHTLHSDSARLSARKQFAGNVGDVFGFYGELAAREESESGIRYRKNGRISTMSEQAMTNVAQAFGNANTSVKYFDPGTMVAGDLLPEGINVYVLGPPRNSLINKSNPSHGQHRQTYLGLDNLALEGFIDALYARHESAGSDGEENFVKLDSASPFSEKLGLDDDKATSSPFFSKYYFEKDEYRRIDEAWLDVAGQFALQLDGAVNNTSLVLAIEIVDSGKVMLFPGDAQVGSWLSWHDYEWKRSANPQLAKDVTIEELLMNTVLYKVSHHGSHNATIKDNGLEMMTHPELVALIPEKEKSYNGILHEPLMDRLEQLCKGRVLVSADVNYPPEKFNEGGDRPAALTEREWHLFIENLSVTKTFVEYTVS